MRDDLIADALRAHVTAQEPPMGLTAPDLVAAGRRSHLVRLGPPPRQASS